MAFGSMLCCAKGSNRREQVKKQSAWRIFTLKELLAATNNFNFDNKLGEGAYGSVYWGQLWDGSQIAVKRLKALSNNAEMEFAADLEMLARVQHKNLLSLRGYCAEPQERLIVYDFMPNQSLLSHLHGLHSADYLLDWNRRMKIAIGSSEGIAYLHHSANPHIIHGNIKASNLLLDSNFQARVAEFGFAIMFIPEGATHVTSKGTFGYLAPEYVAFRKSSQSCDVYSFGIILLELATGRKPLQKVNATPTRTITEWALPLACEKKFTELADPRLNGMYVDEELKRVVLLGLICAHSQPEKRPTMLEVVELLKGGLKEKFSDIEKDEMFKSPQPAGDTDGLLDAQDSSEDITEDEKSSRKIENVA